MAGSGFLKVVSWTGCSLLSPKGYVYITWNEGQITRRISCQIGRISEESLRISGISAESRESLKNLWESQESQQNLENLRNLRRISGISAESRESSQNLRNLCRILRIFAESQDIWRNLARIWENPRILFPESKNLEVSLVESINFFRRIYVKQDDAWKKRDLIWLLVFDCRFILLKSLIQCTDFGYTRPKMLFGSSLRAIQRTRARKPIRLKVRGEKHST